MFWDLNIIFYLEYFVFPNIAFANNLCPFLGTLAN